MPAARVIKLPNWLVVVALGATGAGPGLPQAHHSDPAAAEFTRQPGPRSSGADAHRMEARPESGNRACRHGAVVPGRRMALIQISWASGRPVEYLVGGYLVITKGPGLRPRISRRVRGCCWPIRSTFKIVLFAGGTGADRGSARSSPCSLTHGALDLLTISGLSRLRSWAMHADRYCSAADFAGVVAGAPVRSLGRIPRVLHRSVTRRWATRAAAPFRADRSLSPPVPWLTGTL
jgi:hypothetical protein